MIGNTKFFVLEAILSMSAAAPASVPEIFANSRGGFRNDRNLRGVRGTEISGRSGDGGPNSDRENYFQEIYMLQSAPKQLEFGHVCENPHEWEQRYEKKDFDLNRHQGKVRWADKAGSHGEHYWDYNHSGPSQQKQEESREEPKNGPPQQQRKRELSREGESEKENREGFQSFVKGFTEGLSLERNRRLLPKEEAAAAAVAAAIPSQDIPKNHRRRG